MMFAKKSKRERDTTVDVRGHLLYTINLLAAVGILLHRSDGLGQCELENSVP